MGDILDEASALVQCRECPWYRSCVTPLHVTPQELQSQLQVSGMVLPLDTASLNQPAFSDLLARLVVAAQNRLLEGCPIFIQRLRASSRVAEQLKKIMQSWGMAEGE